MKELSKHAFRIGDIELDPAQGCIKLCGEEQYLRQKAFQLLLYLVEHRERLVTKQELVGEIWEGTAVGDDALVQLIKEVRKVLGDDPRQPRFIKTFPKAGYRFIGAVNQISSDPHATVETEVTTVELEYEQDSDNSYQRTSALPALGRRRWPMNSRRFAAMTTVVLVAAIVLGFYLRWANQPLPGPSLLHLPGKRALAVMYFENQSGAADMDWLREGLADMLITELSRSKELTVLSRGQLHMLLERMGHNDAGAIELSDALDIGRRSGAETIVIGSFAALRTRTRINVQLHEVSTGQIVAAESLTVEEPLNILSQIDLLSVKLATHLGVTPDREKGLAGVMTNNLEAYRYYSLGVGKADELQNTEAIALLEKAVALDPQFAMAHARIGYVYAVRSNLAEKAKPYLEKAFELSDRLTEKDKLYIAGWYAIANLDFPAAITSFREIIANYPLEVEAYWRLAHLLQGEERLEEALDVARRGLAIDAEAKHLYKQLGDIYCALNKHDDAIAMDDRYVALSPEEPNAYDSLGLAYQWAGRYDEAMREYERALQINPRFEVALIHLANTYFQQGRYRQAIAAFQKYVQMMPSDNERARGYSCIALVHLKMRDLSEAQLTVKKQLGVNPNTLVHALRIALEHGDLAMAARLKEQLTSALYTNRGTRRPLRELYFYDGYLALKSGRASEAIEYLKEAVRHLPPIWSIDPLEDCLANAYLELGRWDQAVAEYQRILNINPNYPLARYHLAQAYDRKGAHEQARQEYQAFLQVWESADPDIPEVIDARKRLSTGS